MQVNLKAEILAGESYSLEFKLVPNEDRIKYLKTVVAFANGRGGRILFGVSNDRSVVGIPDSEIFTAMDMITDSVANGCAPQIPMDISIENIDGKSIIALDVFAGSRCPYYLKSEGEKDGVYLRVGATTRPADDAAWHDLAMESLGRSFDREPCAKAKIDDARIKALCSKMYRIARSNCRNESERKSVKRVTGSQLESWGIISRIDGRWIGSNAYAMLTGDKAFSLRIRCGVFKGDSKAVFVDRREFTGSICDLIDKAHEYILSKINMGMKIVGAQRRDIYELPPDELRELVVNAFVHRNYFDHEAPIFIAVYDTRVEITSPGSLPRGLTAEKALSGCSKIRNRAIASALTYMRYVEGWGSGLLRVSSSLVNSGLAPLEVVDDVVDVKVNVYRLASSSDKSGQGEKVPIGAETVPIGGKNMPIGVSAGREYKSYNTSTTRVQQARTTPVQHLDDSEFIKLRELSSSSQRVFKALTEDGTLTVRGLASKLNLNKSTVSVAIGRLVKAGFIVRVGAKTFGGHWKVVEENCNENA